MTDVTAPAATLAPPANAAEAAAMASALQTYAASRLNALAAFVDSTDFTGLAEQLKAFAADQLPACNTAKNLQNLLTCMNALQVTAPQDIAPAPKPTA